MVVVFWVDLLDVELEHKCDETHEHERSIDRMEIASLKRCLGKDTNEYIR